MLRSGPVKKNRLGGLATRFAVVSLILLSLACGSTDEVQEAVDEGDALYDEGRFLAASEAYTKAIALDRNRADVLNRRGFVYKDMGQIQAAIIDFEAAIRLDPNLIPS